MKLNLSERMLKLQPSPTLALNTKAKELKAQGNDVLNFTVGEPDYGTPAPITAHAIQALQEGQTRYGQAGGGAKLRRAIAEKLRRENQLAFEPAQIVCGVGAKEILFHLFLALLNEGDEVLLTAPYWVSYEEQIRAAGAVPVVIPLPSSLDESLVDPQRIEKYASAKTVAYILCSPNNPAGYVLNADELNNLGAYLQTKPWWIVADEVYEYMTFDSPHLSLLQVCPQLREQFILVHSFSKSFAMTGWRVGYAAGPVPAIELVRTLQSHSSTCLPPFIEEAATWAVQQGRSLMLQDIKRLAHKRDLALTQLREIKGVSCILPQGAFYLFVDLRPVLKRHKAFAPANSLAFCEHLLATQHMATVPGEAFGVPGFLRLSYACEEETLVAGMKRLSNALAAL